jgi:hypothetical protein
MELFDELILFISLKLLQTVGIQQLGAAAAAAASFTVGAGCFTLSLRRCQCYEMSWMYGDNLDDTSRQFIVTCHACSLNTCCVLSVSDFQLCFASVLSPVEVPRI